MTSNSKTEINITLVLSSEEAHILASLVQNAQVPPEEEPGETSQLREDIFNACKQEEDN